SQFVSHLEALGFFKYVPPATAESEKREFQRIGWAAVFGETGRLFHADHEDLAEGGVGDYLRRIEPFLRRQGGLLEQVEDDCGDHGYWVTVNGRRYTVYDAAELGRSEEQLGLIWGLSGARAFAVVNELLGSVG